MSHTCTNALVRCIDFRLEPAIQKYLNDNNLAGDTDIIAFAGAVKDINDGLAVAGQLELSHQLHATKTIILMNHTDCGGYGGRAAFEGREAEWEHHVAELNKAKEAMSAMLPDVEIKLAIADVLDDGSVEIKSV
jgi:carbonic anhydrase